MSITCSIISLIFSIWFRLYELKRRRQNEKVQEAQQQRQDSWKNETSLLGAVQTPLFLPPPVVVGGGQPYI